MLNPVVWWTAAAPAVRAVVVSLRPPCMDAGWGSRCLGCLVNRHGQNGSSVVSWLQRCLAVWVCNVVPCHAVGGPHVVSCNDGDSHGGSIMVSRAPHSLEESGVNKALTSYTMMQPCMTNHVTTWSALHAACESATATLIRLVKLIPPAPGATWSPPH